MTGSNHSTLPVWSSPTRVLFIGSTDRGRTCVSTCDGRTITKRVATFYPGLLLIVSSALPSQNDSIEGIYDTLKECAAISKSAGGIGLSIHNIRATVSRA